MNCEHCGQPAMKGWIICKRCQEIFMTDSEWYYEGAKNGGRVLAKDDRKTIIHEPPCSPFNEQAIADAKLIAAAPDMLEALRKAVVMLAWVGSHAPELRTNEVYEAVSAAIAKATGCSA